VSHLRRAIAALAVALGVLASFPATAAAHPLGNFTVNHLSIVTVGRDAVDVRYVLDLAEIPTLQEANAGTMASIPDRIARALELRVDGQPVPLNVQRSTSDRIAGQAGLETLRVTVDLVAAAALRDSAALSYRDLSFPGRVGWHDVVLRGAVADASVGPDDATDELRAYPADPAVTPPDRLEASARVALGSTVGNANAAPSGVGRFAIDANADRLTAFLRGGDADVAALLAALVVAMILGALHALGPGHGKAVVAAYLVGSKGTAREAVILGATVTLTHTLGVYALGLVTLVAAQVLVPEAIYPILGVASGAVVTVTGIALLRSRLRRRESPAHAHAHEHDRGHGPGQHQHARDVGMRGLLALGVSGGLLPCPTALVILLAAVSFHNVLLGMALVAAFSVGLASVLTAVGLALVWGRGMLQRNSRALELVRSRAVAVAGRYLPAASAGAIALAGLVITVQSIRGFS
jgi:ABC-type nickel/cobalt efflux system permease component RcnA